MGRRLNRLQAAATPAAMASTARKRRRSSPPAGKRPGGGSARDHRGSDLLLLPGRRGILLLLLRRARRSPFCHRLGRIESNPRRVDWASSDSWMDSAAETLVVRSPRQTVSLLRNRSRRPQFDRERERERDPAAAAGPKPSEVYGFVGSITTVIATAVYLAWAYTPEPWLHSLGITYYPTKYWAVAVPAFVMVAVPLSLLAYVGSNFHATPPPTSFTTIFDEYTRERTTATMLDATTEQEEQKPIEPISDISIHHINTLMFPD